MSEYIPLEVQEKILKRLPVKPLIQFRTVSKQWKSLIDSPEFIVAYGVRETHPNHFILRYTHTIDSDRVQERYLTFVDNDDDDDSVIKQDLRYKKIVESYYYVEERYIAFVDNDDDHSFIKQDFTPTVPGLIKKLEYLSVVGSSHGLLCFEGHHRTKMAVLWNPSISKSIGIEVPSMDDFRNNRIGFGVCPVTCDPSIVKIETFHVGIPWKVKVFTLSTGTWSILSNNLPCESMGLIGSQVVIDRFIYWLSFDKLVAEDDRSQIYSLIMSFDLTVKEFKEIRLSDSLICPLCEIQTISKLRESLVLLEDHTECEEHLAVGSLWMMKEQGLNRSFTKLYNINLLPDVTINNILGFRKTGELILETVKGFEGHAEVQIYDPNSETIDKIALLGEKRRFFMCSYMETSLLLDQLDSFIYSISH